jgi:hypothetical protein
MSVSEASMSAKTFAGFPNDRRIAIPTSDATRTKILALRSSNEPRSSFHQHDQREREAKDGPE